MSKCCKKTNDGLLITWLPKESGPNKLFRVVYVIDVPGSNSLEAAKEAQRIMNDPDSMLPVLHMLLSDGQVETIDLNIAGPRQGGD